MTVVSAVEHPPLLARLKADTRPHHEAAETALDLLGAGLTLARYRDVLSWLRPRHAQLEAPLEALLREALPPTTWAELNLPGRRKVPLLDLDLAALDARPGPAPTPPDWVRTEGHAWGVLYVLEGATLGGQLVVRHLRHLNFPQGALRYYGGYGDQTGPRWRTFGTLLSARHAQAAQPATFAADAIDAAQRTFTLLTFPSPPAAPEGA